MKLVSFNHDGKDGYGAVLDGGILDLSGALYQESHFANLREVFAAGPGALTELNRLVKAGSATLGMSDVRVRMPIHNPTKIFCVGRNYYAYHEVKADGRPEWPSIFPRFRDSFSAHDEPIIRGKDDGDQLDYEGELVVVIGKQGRHIAEKDSMSLRVIPCRVSMIFSSGYSELIRWIHEFSNGTPIRKKSRAFPRPIIWAGTGS